MRSEAVRSVRGDNGRPSRTRDVRVLHARGEVIMPNIPVRMRVEFAPGSVSADELAEFMETVQAFARPHLLPLDSGPGTEEVTFEFGAAGIVASWATYLNKPR